MYSKGRTLYMRKESDTYTNACTGKTEANMVHNTHIEQLWMYNKPLEHKIMHEK